MVTRTLPLTECCLSKNANWKQITTSHVAYGNDDKLNVVYQRTQIESKSQLHTSHRIRRINWMLFIKERKLKANHNSKMPDLEEAITECCLSKNANWKQITTMDVKQTHSSYWMLFIKERKLKANHNSFTSSEAFNNTECCLSKNANWKQITTYRVNSWCNCQLNVVYQRTQIESKSQLQLITSGNG